MGVEGAEALAALIQAGACPALERLSLAQVRLGLVGLMGLGGWLWV